MGSIGRQFYKVSDRVAYIETDPILQALMAGMEMSISHLAGDRIECLMLDCSISSEMPLSNLQLGD